MWVHLLRMKKGVSLVDEKITKKMTIEMTKKTEMISGINQEVVQNFKVSLDEKRKSNLKLLKDKIL